MLVVGGWTVTFGKVRRGGEKFAPPILIAELIVGVDCKTLFIKPIVFMLLA